MTEFGESCVLWLPERDELPPASGGNLLVWPLTYDAADQNGANVLTQSGATAAPHVTPLGFEGDGYAARYRLTALPAWQNAAAQSVSLFASVTVYGPKHNATRDVVVALGVNDATANPKLELALVADPSDATTSCLALRGYTGSIQTLYLARPTWRFEWQMPETVVRGQTCYPQALVFIDDDSILVSSHVNNTESRAYRVRLSDGETTGFFSWGLTTHRHVGSFAWHGDDLWCTDGSNTYHTLKLDLGHSLGTQRAQILETWDTSVLTANGGLAFVTVGGVDYVCLMQYKDVAPAWLYVFPVSAMGTPATIAGRFKRFDVGLRVQDICIKNGVLYASRNLRQGDPTIIGWIESYDIAAAITGSADGATLVPLARWYGPSNCSEGVDFHPTTGELWSLVEGLSSPGDLPAWFSAWSTTLGGAPNYQANTAPQKNDVLVNYDGGNDAVSVYLNGRVHTQSITWNLTATPGALSIGGPPQAVAGISSGFAVCNVANVAIKDGRFSAAEYAALVAGTYEPLSLTAYVVALVNPGAETGDASGWTNETGTLGVRSTNPIPFEGGFYFRGVSAGAGTVARQRFSLAAVTGLSTAAIDALAAAGNLWAKARWWQSTFDQFDPGTLGVRFLNATPAQQTLEYSGVVMTSPDKVWVRRSLASLASNLSRNVDAVIRSDYQIGTSTDAYFDSLELVLYARQ